MKKRVAISVITLMVTAAAICGYFFMLEFMTAQEEIAEYNGIQNQYTTTTPVQIIENDEDVPVSETDEAPDSLIPYIEVDFEALLQVNPDTVGWIAIPNTVISYPVVQTVNNTKYLNTSFEGNRSNVGTPFADKGNDLQNLDSNTIIYGHNMGTGRTDMFGTLLLYKEHDYFLINRFIQFDTIYERHGFWKVFAVIQLDISNTDFVYQQTTFRNSSEFMEWVSMSMELSLHDTDIDINSQDRILTLSTCDRSRYGRNGRLIVLAVKREYGFTYG